MKSRTLKAATLAAVAVAFFAVGAAAARPEAHHHKTTTENLATAMHGEAFAFAKYLLYAEHARKGGNLELARLFESAAHTERFEHFAEEARLAGIVANDAENLKDAIQGESYEVETMYRQFAEQANAVGDTAAAQRFEEIRQDEMKHRDAFQAALDRAGKGSPTAP